MTSRMLASMPIQKKKRRFQCPSTDDTDSTYPGDISMEASKTAVLRLMPHSRDVTRLTKLSENDLPQQLDDDSPRKACQCTSFIIFHNRKDEKH